MKVLTTLHSHVFLMSQCSFRIQTGKESLNIVIGPSGVRALPLAAGINEGGHYFGPSVLRVSAEQLRWPLF